MLLGHNVRVQVVERTVALCATVERAVVLAEDLVVATAESSVFVVNRIWLKRTRRRGSSVTRVAVVWLVLCHHHGDSSVALLWRLHHWLHAIRRKLRQVVKSRSEARWARKLRQEARRPVGRVLSHHRGTRVMLCQHLVQVLGVREVLRNKHQQMHWVGLGKPRNQQRWEQRVSHMLGIAGLERGKGEHRWRTRVEHQ